jgi:group I intron endonuclease
MGFIYCLHSPSGKCYIGQTRRSVEKRVKEHEKSYSGCIALNSAITKYGFNSFKVETLMEVNDELLDVYEKKFIEAFDSFYPNGYNIRSGGSLNSQHTAESRERMRVCKRGDKNPNFGKPRNEATKAAISVAKSGVKHHFYGKSLSISHRENLSISHKKEVSLPMYLVKIKARPEHYTSGGYAVVNHPHLPTRYFTSKKLSDESKLKLASEYLNSGNMDAVQRLNGDGSCDFAGLKIESNP